MYKHNKYNKSINKIKIFMRYNKKINQVILFDEN